MHAWQPEPDATRIEREGPGPWFERLAPVAPEVLCLEIQARRVTRMRQMPYEPQPGDERDSIGYSEVDGLHRYRVVRNGQAIGFLVGPKRDILCTFEQLLGDALDEPAADQAGSYSLGSGDDERHAGGLAPIAVWRKTRVNNWNHPEHRAAKRHHLYLAFPQPLQEGARYTLTVSGFAVDRPEVDYTHDPTRVRSEAVHISHVGFRPDDPGKCAFLSVWLGTGGARSYGDGPAFYLLDDDTDEEVFEGRAALVRGADEPEHLKREANYNLTDVYRMDFGEFEVPGRFRVCVEGVGCSYPFEIGAAVWQRAFAVSMKGCYHHRSGIELGPPYTDYIRPRCFHPGDGVKVYQSTCPLMYSGNGLNALGTDENNFGNLVAGKTDEVLDDAWGAYQDAGDWDRRIQHLDASRLQLELVDLYPDYFRGVDLNIPESADELPDVVGEALFNIDGYRRLQTADGGVRGGIESSEHPVAGECSWQESHVVMAYAPGLWSSHVYAGAAARAAHVLHLLGSERAEDYEESALRAMEWAEREFADWPGRPEYPQVRDGAKERVRDDRCLAAVELYRLTGDERWHSAFAETTRLRGEPRDVSDRQRDAAFVYARLSEDATDAELRAAAVGFTVRDGERAVAFAQGNAWGITTPYYERAPYMGFYTMPGSMQVVRGHVLTGRPEFLDAIVRSCVFGAGGNPMNLCMTTGVGHDWPRNPLHVDSRHSGQPAPSGITLYGAADIPSLKDSHYWTWPLRHTLADDCTPSGWDWPPPEGYFDIYSWAAVCEYTIMQTLGPNSYVWGYLAARP